MATMLARWLLGTSLVTWRYLWMTTPLHRSLSEGDRDEDLPPALPPDLIDADSQLAAHGVGPLFHRTFTIEVADARCSPEELMSSIIGDFGRFVPREVVTVTGEDTAALRPGQEMVVRMPGPWDGPVRVVEVAPRVLRLATLIGHLEAGQVRFNAESRGSGLTFTVETWARCANRKVEMLYGHLRVAKEVQLNMWVRFCLSVAEAAQGHPRDGVRVATRAVAPELLPIEPTADGRSRLGNALPGPVRVFPFRFAPSYRPAAALFGVTASTSSVIITPEELLVHFGPWRLRTSRSNIEGAQRSGGFSWLLTAGPAHLSLSDRGITFATNGEEAICLTFREPVPAIEPTGRLRHPGATLTVADPEGLLELLG